MREIDDFFLYKDEPVKSCLQFLRNFILNFDTAITEAWKYNMPFYFYKGQRFCYIWIHKKTGWPFIGFTDGKRLEHPLLTFEDRSRIKIMLINPEADIPVNDISTIIKMALTICDKDL